MKNIPLYKLFLTRAGTAVNNENRSNQRRTECCLRPLALTFTHTKIFFRIEGVKLVFAITAGILHRFLRNVLVITGGILHRFLRNV